MNNNETVEQVCEKELGIGLVFTHNGGMIYCELDSDELKEKILAAHKREIAAKDAEIASLRSLVKELADALKKIDDACDGDMCKHFIDTEQCSKCKYLETCQTGIAHNALKTNESEIAKSLEVCK